MPLDLYSNLLRPPKSVADYDAEAQASQANALAIGLKRNELANAPVQNQLLQLELQGRQLGNQRATNLNALLGGIAGRFNGAAPQQAPDVQSTAAHVQALAGVNTPQDALRWVQAGKDQGILTPEQSQLGFKNVQALASPEAFAQWKQQAMQGGAAQVAQLRAGGQPPQASGMPSNFPLSFNDVVALKMAGGPDLTTDFKTALEGVSRVPGSEVTDIRGNRRMVPKLAEGQMLNSDGSIGNIPGAVASAAQAAGATAGATTAAQEAAKAPYTLVDTYANGTPGKVPLSTLIQPPSQPKPRQASVIAPDVQAGRESERVAILKGELQSAQARLSRGDPRAQGDIDALNRELVGTPGFNPTGPSEPAKARAAAASAFATDTAKGAADEGLMLNKEVAKDQEFVRNINAARAAVANFTPGMGQQGMLRIGRFFDSMGAHDAAKAIARGDISSQILFDKIAGQGAMEALQQAMQQGRITQSEYKIFLDRYPNGEMPRAAIGQVFDLMQERYSRSFQQQQQRADYLKAGGDPANWAAEWARRVDPTGTGQISTPNGPPSNAPGAVNRGNASLSVRTPDGQTHTFPTAAAAAAFKKAAGL
jgi:hypothetical protein